MYVKKECNETESKRWKKPQNGSQGWKNWILQKADESDTEDLKHGDMWSYVGLVFSYTDLFVCDL